MCPVRTFSGFQGFHVFVPWIFIKASSWIQAYQTPSLIAYTYSVCKGLGIFRNVYPKIYLEKSTEPTVRINYCSCSSYIHIQPALLLFSPFSFQSIVRVDYHCCSNHAVVGQALLRFLLHVPVNCQKRLL